MQENDLGENKVEIDTESKIRKREKRKRRAEWKNKDNIKS